MDLLFPSLWEEKAKQWDQPRENCQAETWLGRYGTTLPRLVSVSAESSTNMQPILFQTCSWSWKATVTGAAGPWLQTAQVNVRSWFQPMSELAKREDYLNPAVETSAWSFPTFESSCKMLIFSGYIDFFFLFIAQYEKLSPTWVTRKWEKKYL